MVIFAYRQVLILLCIRKLAPTRKKEKGERRRAPRQEGWNKKRCKRRKDHTHRHRQSSRRKTKVFFLLSFSDLSHHRTCRSAYGGSLHSVQLNIVVHQARVASTTEFLVPSGVVHNAFRISPTSLAAIPVDSSPVWLDTALD